jgi:hypothetical protein
VVVHTLREGCRFGLIFYTANRVKKITRLVIYSCSGGTYNAPLANPVAVDEVVESEQGDLDYTFGRWWQSGPDAAPTQGGRWLAIWQPMDGAWQITHI